MPKLSCFLMLCLTIVSSVEAQNPNPAVNNGPPAAPIMVHNEADNVLWNQVASALQPIGRSGTAVLGNYMYCIGSEAGNYAQAFNLTTEQWQASTPPPFGNDNWPAVATNNAIYLIGRSGLLEIGDQVQRFTPTGSGPTGTWAQMAPYPYQAFGIFAAWDGANKIYAAGGVTDSSDLNTAYSYNIANNEWSRIADLPVPMEFAGAAYIQGKFHVLGGNTTGLNHYSYNPITNAWVSEAFLPTPVYFGTSSVSANESYIFSVGGGGGYAGWPATDAVQIYNPITGNWTQETPLPVARGCNSAAWVGAGKVISAGGWVPPWTNITYRGTGFPGGTPPVVDATVTPLAPPIVIPANGGSFGFTAAVVDSGPVAQPFSVWARMKYPDGSWTAPVLGPVTINPPLYVTITRQRTQNIPGSYPPGLYYYVGYAALSFGGVILDSSYFTFTKTSVVDGSGFVTNDDCTGELFPGELTSSPKRSAFSLAGVHSNQYNGTTEISYKLQASSYVSLNVYDIAGRLIKNLAKGWQEAGEYKVTFDGSGLASGMYFVKMTAGRVSAVQKVILLK